MQARTRRERHSGNLRSETLGKKSLKHLTGTEVKESSFGSFNILSVSIERDLIAWRKFYGMNLS